MGGSGGGSVEGEDLFISYTICTPVFPAFRSVNMNVSRTTVPDAVLSDCSPSASLKLGNGGSPGFILLVLRNAF